MRCCFTNIQLAGDDIGKEASVVLMHQINLFHSELDWSNLYWQTPPNWKKVRFRKRPYSQHFHRVTRWDRVTRFRDFETILTDLGTPWPPSASRDLTSPNDAKSRKSRYTCTKRARPASTD